MKSLLLFLLACTTASTSLAQSVGANLTVGRPQAVCTFSSATTLEFGTLYSPADAAATATLTAGSDTPTLSYAPGFAGDPRIGSLSVRGTDVASIDITVTFPDDLTDGDTSPTILGFTGNWASSTAASSATWTAESGTTQTYTNATPANPLERFFQFGGAVPIAVAQKQALYTGTITVSATCNQASG